MDLKKIKSIVELVKQSGIAELEITEGEEKLRITTLINNPQVTHIVPQTHAHAAQHSAPAQLLPPVAPSNIDAVATLIEQVNHINSPMVGTFYRSASPTSAPFVEVGQLVKAGQVLCIIEAMKLMNQIESDQDGIIKEIMVKDGSPVEYGQPLFVIA